MKNNALQKQYFDAANDFYRKRKLQESGQFHHVNGTTHHHQIDNNNNQMRKKKKSFHNVNRVQRELLPIHFGKRALISEVMKNESIIVMSETGSGKTTQLPQYLLKTELSQRGVICCTQPRRVAAITVAARVAEERNVPIGDLVGYTVRFEDVTSAKTKLKYMTDGMLLREALLDPLLQKYSVIILDEAHERSVQTDVLFGVVKRAQANRRTSKPLKIIVMSATLQADEFSKYFNNAKVCFIEGRRHPIKILYTEEIQKDYTHACIVTALQLHREKPLGHDILVFLTGQEEIDSVSKIIQDIVLHAKEHFGNIDVRPLFASLPNSVQIKAFQPTQVGRRKIILATNIAETSVTIPGVKYVVDCGMVKAKAYSPSTSLDMLKVQPISKAQSRQRCGRAGRECPGECFRLYPEKSFLALNEDTVPEIQRCNLKSVVLHLLALGLKDVLTFDFMSQPHEGGLQDALNQLLLLGAVESVESQKITDKGKLLATFPLDPALSSCILAAQELGCTEEVLTIVSLLSVESLTYTPHNQRERSRKSLQKFMSSEGDHVSMLLLYRAFKHAKKNVDWCREHFINVRNMTTVSKIKKQIREISVRSNITLKSCGTDYSLIRKALAAGMFMNSAERQKDGTYLTIKQRQQVQIHPSSVLFNSKPSFVVFNEVMETSKRYMRNLCVVDPTWLVQASPTYFDGKNLIPQSVAT